MFVDLPCGEDTLFDALFSKQLRINGDQELLLQVVGTFANDTNRYRTSRCRIYSTDEFFELSEFDELKRLLGIYAVNNVEGALFEANPDGEYPFRELALDMAEQDDYAGEITISIIELYAKQIFYHIAKIEIDDEFFYLVERE